MKRCIVIFRRSNQSFVCFSILFSSLRRGVNVRPYHQQRMWRLPEPDGWLLRSAESPDALMPLLHAFVVVTVVGNKRSTHQ